MAYESTDKENLILEHLPLVKNVVSRIDSGHSGYDQEDLVNIGIIGLIDAIDKFDNSKNVPFEAYARIRIRGSVIDELRRSGPVSRNRMDRLNEYYKAKKDLENKFLRTVTEQEICDELGIGSDELSTIHETVHYLSNVSLESTIYSEEGDDSELIDIIEDRDAVLPEDIFEDNEMKEALLEAIKKLKEKEQLLLNLYYVEELTMKEIGYILEVSVPRVSQMHGQVVIKLRNLLNPYLEV